MARQPLLARGVFAVMVLVALACSGGDGNSEDVTTLAPIAPAPPPSAADTTAGDPVESTDSRPTATTPSTSTTMPSTTSTTDATTTTELAEELALGELSVDPLDAHLDGEGLLGLDEALALFAATFAPLPGVDAAEDPAPDAAGLTLSTITPHLSQLPVGQAAVVEAVLGDDAVPLDELLRRAGFAGFGRPAADRLDDATPILAEAEAYFAEKLGRSLDVLITVVQHPAVDEDGVRRFSPTEGARATPLYDPDSLVYDECLVALNTSTTFDTNRFRSQVSHEMFHCFQFALGNARPAWVQEGSAAYAGEEFAGGTDQSATWWHRWIREPHRSLTARSYDAIGLFALGAALGVDPYDYFDELLARPVLGTIEVLVGPRLAEAWGLHLANEPSWGADFAIRGPGAPTQQARRIPLSVVAGGTAATFTHLPESIRDAAQVYELDVDADGDVLTVDAARSTGGMRFSDGTEVRFPVVTDVCLLPSGCACPSGESPTTVSTTSRTAYVGLGPFPLSPPDLTASTLDEWCEETSPTTTTLPPPDPAQCQIGEWVTTSYELPALPGATMSSGGQGVVVSFGEDGSFVADYSGMTPIVSSAAIEDGPQVNLSVTFSGVLTGTWAAGDGGVLQVNGSLGSVHVVATSIVGGQKTTVIDSSLAELLRELGAAFLTVSDCTGDTMRLTNEFEGFSQVLTLSRTS